MWIVHQLLVISATIPGINHQIWGKKLFILPRCIPKRDTLMVMTAEDSTCKCFQIILTFPLPYPNESPILFPFWNRLPWLNMPLTLNPRSVWYNKSENRGDAISDAKWRSSMGPMLTLPNTRLAACLNRQSPPSVPRNLASLLPCNATNPPYPCNPLMYVWPPQQNTTRL